MTSDPRLQINELIHGDVNTAKVYRFPENGREYYAYSNTVTYPFPCDEDEARRLDQFHHLIHNIALKGKLFTADLTVRGRRPRILDVGHGTGIWALQMASQCPEADIFGIDLIDTQADPQDPCPNVSFKTPVDITSPNWGFPESSFDLIRMSQLCGSIPSWSQQYRIVYKYLKPGTGCIEHVEIDWEPRWSNRNGFPASLQPLQDWWNAMVQASDKLGRPIIYREDTRELLTNAGFTDITHRTVRISLQAHPRDEWDQFLKRSFQSFVSMTDDGDGGVPKSFEGLSMSLLYRQLRWAPEQIRSLCETLRSIYGSDRWPLYHNIQVWTARKPMS